MSDLLIVNPKQWPQNIEVELDAQISESGESIELFITDDKYCSRIELDKKQATQLKNWLDGYLSS